MITTINGHFGDFRVLAEHLVQWFAFEIAFSHNVAIVGHRCRQYPYPAARSCPERGSNRFAISRKSRTMPSLSAWSAKSIDWGTPRFLIDGAEHPTSECGESADPFPVAWDVYGFRHFCVGKFQNDRYLTLHVKSKHVSARKKLDKNVL